MLPFEEIFSLEITKSKPNGTRSNQFPHPHTLSNLVSLIIKRHYKPFNNSWEFNIKLINKNVSVGSNKDKDMCSFWQDIVPGFHQDRR